MLLDNLIAALAARLGPRQANLELKWLKRPVRSRSLPKHTSLPGLIKRRIDGEPLQYILGSQPFGPLNLLVRPPVLIPRPETEHWVIKLADHLLSPTSEQSHSLLDLGTGTGCIPLLFCHLARPGTLRATSVDISPHAIKLAQDNADLCGFATTSNPTIPRNTCNIMRANILSPSVADDLVKGGPYNIITSNPPYITWDEFLHLPRSVSDFEDPLALFGGPNGLQFYEAIAQLVQNKDVVASGATIALEIGAEQKQSVESLLRSTSRVRTVETWDDPWGKPRTVIAQCT